MRQIPKLTCGRGIGHLARMCNCLLPKTKHCRAVEQVWTWVKFLFGSATSFKKAKVMGLEC
jgi:hypothetical protein